MIISYEKYSSFLIFSWFWKRKSFLLPYTFPKSTRPWRYISRHVLFSCKDTTTDLSENEWNLRATKNATMKQFWVWSKSDGANSGGYAVTGEDFCIDFEKELLFEIVKSMRRNHYSVLQYHVK